MWLHCSVSILTVLDMIIDFLPNPNEQQNFNKNINNDGNVKSCGIVFKVFFKLNFDIF